MLPLRSANADAVSIAMLGVPSAKVWFAMVPLGWGGTEPMVQAKVSVVFRPLSSVAVIATE